VEEVLDGIFADERRIMRLACGSGESEGGGLGPWVGGCGMKGGGVNRAGLERIRGTALTRSRYTQLHATIALLTSSP
jgi:hypothetical protein